MRIKLDENLPRVLVDLFSTAGHDPATVLEEGLSGAADEVVLGEAVSEGRLLITLDRGFADIRAYPPGSYAGIVVFHLEDQRRSSLERASLRLIESGIMENLQQGLAVVDEVRIRIRTAKGTRQF